MRIIVTRPQHDVTTRYLAGWAEEIIDLARKKGVTVIDLNKDKANKDGFVGRMKKVQPELVFLNGHGGDNCVCGHDNEQLVKSGENHNVLKDKVTYALSCNSGKTLGEQVAKNRNTTYIGYKDEFIFISDDRYVTRPLEDPRAKPFRESSNQVMISLLKGKTAQEASEKSKEKFNKCRIEMLSSGSDSDSLQAAQFLWWNGRNQVCLGDTEARL
ncbi:MAG: hypothetical protein HQ530_00315 [Parcubacteria group bacterium]|nr:hypothetical protein [Parcubacteria group bacterium]